MYSILSNCFFLYIPNLHAHQYFVFLYLIPFWQSLSSHETFEPRIQILRYTQKVYMFTCCVTVNNNNIIKHEFNKFNLNNTVYRCLF